MSSVTSAESQEDDAASYDRPGVGADPARNDKVAEHEVEDAFRAVVDEGRRRLSRRWPALISTGLVGGVDVATGVLGLLVVESLTHDNALLGGLAFSVGFVALTLARSELFTEDFLIPVSTVIARQARFRMLLRLWLVTYAANLFGGWVFTYFIVRGFPAMSSTAISSGAHYVDLGINLTSFSLAILGGAVITLMTWMQHSTDSMGGKIVAAVMAGFLLGGSKLNHTIVNSLLMFAALHTGHAPFGYLDWLKTALWAAFGNIVGGVGLVTLLRIGQIPHVVKEERANPAPGVAIGDQRREDRPGT